MFPDEDNDYDQALAFCSLKTKTKVLLVQEYFTTSEESGMRVKLFQITSVTVFSVGSNTMNAQN